MQSITIARVIKSYYVDNKSIWPDGVYPHRFKFEIIGEPEENVYFGTEFYSREFVEAVRYSACTQEAVTKAANISRLEDITLNSDDEDFDLGLEGRPIFRLHKSRERDCRLVKSKKVKVLQETGSLCCEICSMDFRTVYGELGTGFAECHHKEPLSMREESQSTQLSDLAIVCSNCHRMLHRKRPWLTIEALKAIYENKINK